MNIFYNLYLGKTNGIPKDENGKEFQAIYCLEKKKVISSEIELNPNMNYFVIILQKTQKELFDANQTVKSEWKSFTNLPIEIEHVTNDLNQIKRVFKKLLKTCDMETIIFKSVVIGFDESSELEQNSARKLALNSSTISKWKFWS